MRVRHRSIKRPYFGDSGVPTEFVGPVMHCEVDITLHGQLFNRWILGGIEVFRRDR